MAVSIYGTKGWIENQTWPITKEWHKYIVDGQVGGYVEQRGLFEFATIHGAGHMAPQWKRAPTYRVIFNFIKNKPL